MRRKTIPKKVSPILEKSSMNDLLRMGASRVPKKEDDASAPLQITVTTKKASKTADAAVEFIKSEAERADPDGYPAADAMRLFLQPWPVRHLVLTQWLLQRPQQTTRYDSYMSKLVQAYIQYASLLHPNTTPVEYKSSGESSDDYHDTWLLDDKPLLYCERVMLLDWCMGRRASKHVMGGKSTVDEGRIAIKNRVGGYFIPLNKSTASMCSTLAIAAVDEMKDEGWLEKAMTAWGDRGRRLDYRTLVLGRATTAARELATCNGVFALYCRALTSAPVTQRRPAAPPVPVLEELRQCLAVLTAEAMNVFVNSAELHSEVKAEAARSASTKEVVDAARELLDSYFLVRHDARLRDPKARFDVRLFDLRGHLAPYLNWLLRLAFPRYDYSYLLSCAFVAPCVGSDDSHITAAGVYNIKAAKRARAAEAATATGPKAKKPRILSVVTVRKPLLIDAKTASAGELLDWVYMTLLGRHAP